MLKLYRKFKALPFAAKIAWLIITAAVPMSCFCGYNILRVDTSFWSKLADLWCIFIWGFNSGMAFWFLSSYKRPRL